MADADRNRTAVVVGGGVIGLACAHYLQKAGLSVRVIDRDVIGGECSHGNCGYVCPSHVLPLTVPEAIPMAMRSLVTPRSAFKVKFQFNKSFLAWMLKFASLCKKDVALSAGHHLQSILEASITEYRNLIADENLRCEWRESGLLHVFETQKALDGYRRENEMVIAEFQHGAREVSADELTKLDPTLRSGLAGGFFHESDASLRPDLLNQHWRKLLQARGVTFSEHCDLLQVSRSADGNVEPLKTSQGDIAADVYVFAMGAWSEKLGSMTGFKLPIQPGKGYSITIERPRRCPSLPMLFPEKKIGISPFEHGFRIGSMMEFVGFNDSIPEYRVRQLRESLKPFFDIEFDQREQERWSGFRPMTYDTLPVIGHLPSAKNSFLATGHSMLGVSMAPATGRLIAELATGNEPHIDVQPFDPMRFQ